MPIDPSDPHPLTRILPDTSKDTRVKEYKASELAKNHNIETTRRKHRVYELPADVASTLDTSLAATHQRLLRTIATQSALLEVASKRGLAEDEFDQLTKVAGVWRTLMSIAPKADPLDQKPDESDADYQIRLEGMK